MKKVLILLLMGVFFQVGTAGAVETYFVNPIEDATVKIGINDDASEYSDDNFGLDTLLSVQGTTGENPDSWQQSFLKFDLSGIPDNAVIETAVFGIYLYEYTDADTIDNPSNPWVVVYYVGDDSWIETGTGAINWDNQPDDADIDDGYIQAWQETTSVDENYEWNLLDETTTFWWDDPEVDLLDNNITLMIAVEDDGVNNYARFYSSEAGDSHPYLNITYTVIPEPSSMILGGLGIGVFGALRRRKTL